MPKYYLLVNAYIGWHDYCEDWYIQYNAHFLAVVF